MFVTSPNNVLLLGVVGQSLEPGCQLSPAVRDAVDSAIEAIVLELKFLGCFVEKKTITTNGDIWWTNDRALRHVL